MSASGHSRQGGASGSSAIVRCSPIRYRSGKPADADENRMKLPARDELLRIIAAAGVTLLVVALAVMFFMWVFS